MADVLQSDTQVEKGIVGQHDFSEASGTPPPKQAVVVYRPPEDAKMTAKTWFVIFILSSTFGLSFWPVPTTAAMQSSLGLKWGAPTAIYWFSKPVFSPKLKAQLTCVVPAFTTGCSLGFLLAGSHSDLFGRRLFLLFGNALCCVGLLICGTSKGATQLYVVILAEWYGCNTS